MSKVNVMDTCQNYGKLYAFFLEVCRLHIDDVCPRFLHKSDKDRVMLKFLKQAIRRKYREPYRSVIWRCFTGMERKQLLVESDEIPLKKLDCYTFLKIIKVLETDNEIARCTTNVRNFLCHIPMGTIRKEMSQKDYNREYHWVRAAFELYGVDQRLLDIAYNNISKKRRDNRRR